MSLKKIGIITSLYGVAVFFFWLRIVLIGTITSVLFNVVLNIDLIGYIILFLSWLYTFFVIIRTILLFNKHGETINFEEIHAKGTSRLFWIGLVALIVILAMASIGYASHIILILWSMLLIISLLYMATIDLHPSVHRAYLFKVILGI